MRDALLRGSLGISALSPRVTTGKAQWQEWHHDFFHNQMEDAVQVSSSAETGFSRHPACFDPLTYCIYTGHYVHGCGATRSFHA